MQKKSPLPGKIGLVADSHSDLKALESAIQVLQKRGADCLVHLGDLCDSLRLDLLRASIELIRRHGLLAVKGNNDFLLENLILGQPKEMARGSEDLLAFLQELPMTIVWGEVCFAHSLPFDFLRAFYEPIDVGSVQRAEEVFRLTSHRILFCGHSHQPVLFGSSGRDIRRDPVPIGKEVHLKPDERYILVTGAVAEGECALFDTGAWSLERIRIPCS